MSRVLVLLAFLTALCGCATTAPKVPTTFYPELPQQPRLQYLTSITTEDDLGKKASAFREMVVGKETTKSIARPYDVGSVKGKIYISDRTLKRILILDLEKKEIDYIKEARLGALKDPFGIHVTADGYKYVADAGRRQILVFGPDESYVRAYGEKDQFEKPMDVAVFGEHIYVVDFSRHAVVVLDKESGQTIQTIGSRGTEPGMFNRPTHIRIDRQGNLFVNDAFNFRVQKLDPQGKYLKEYGYAGDTLGGFGRPKGMDVSPDGKLLYVADAAFENVQIFDDESTDLLLFFGTYGNSPGSLYLPSGVYVDAQNLEYFSRYVDKDFKVKYLVIACSMLGEKKLNFYGFGDWVGEKLPEIAPQKPAATAPAKADQAAPPDATK